MDIRDIKQQVSDAGRRLKSEGLVAGTWGNISVRIDNKSMIITPSGIDYESASKDKMVLVNYHDMSYEGSIKPSSEGKLHAEVYITRPEINAVIHTHSMDGSTVACARRAVPEMSREMREHIGSTVEVAKYALPSTKKIVRETMKALVNRNAALMANHGTVGLGVDLEDAFKISHILEQSCRSFINQETPDNAREPIGVTQALAGKLGIYSKRIDEEFMMISIQGANFHNNEKNVLVKVNYRTDTISEPNYEKGTLCDSWTIHSAIYRSMKKMNAIIENHGEYTSELSDLKISTIPSILDDMAQIIGPTLRTRVKDPETSNIVKSLKGRFAVLVPGKGGLCVGRSIKEAETVCEVLEKSSKAFLEAQYLGGAKAINRFEAWFMHMYYKMKYSKVNK